jgi:hypothetical protein
MYPPLIQFETRELEIARTLRLAEHVRAAHARQAEIGANRTRAVGNGPGRLKLRAALKHALGLT